MSTFERMMETRERSEISNLKTTAFSHQDLLNFILQRSQIVHDQKGLGKAINAWIDGDPAPLNTIVEKLGDDLVRRAAAAILLEYEEIAEPIQSLAPKTVADIGCGYALFDYFLFQDVTCDLFLIDIEETKERHFGFQEKGAAYTSLSVARQFLQDNGVPEEKVTCINPLNQDVMTLPEMDLAMSFISCGFHYPVATYDAFFKDRIRAGGGIILDVRNRSRKSEKPVLETYGDVQHLPNTWAPRGTTRYLTVRGSVA